MEHAKESRQLRLGQAIFRVYLSGFILLLILYVGWRAVSQFLPWFSNVENPVLAAIMAVVAVVTVPAVLGCLVRYAINPLMGRWHRWSEMVTLEDRLIGGIAKDTPIVLINWPSESVRTMGIMTAQFAATESKEAMAAVYVSTAPGSKSGYIRVVPLSQVEFTDWSFKDFQLYQFTLGSLGPSKLNAAE